MWVSVVAQMVKRLPAMWETQAQLLDQENPLEKGMSTHSSILAWRIPWTEEPVGLQSMGSQRVRNDLASEHACMQGKRKFFFFFLRESSEKLTQHRYIGCPHVLWFMVVLFLVRERKACIFHLMYYVGFSGSSNGKESTCSVGREENVCSLQYSCLENSMDRGGLQSTGSQRVEYSWATNSFTFSRLCAHPGSS